MVEDSGHLLDMFWQKAGVNNSSSPYNLKHRQRQALPSVWLSAVKRCLLTTSLLENLFGTFLTVAATSGDRSSFCLITYHSRVKNPRSSRNLQQTETPVHGPRLGIPHFLKLPCHPWNPTILASSKTNIRCFAEFELITALIKCVLPLTYNQWMSLRRKG